MKKIFIVLVAISFACYTAKAQTPGNALDFDGTSDYVTASLPTIFTDIANNDFTIETWVKPEGTTTQRIFFAQYNASYFVSLLVSSSNVLYVYVYYGGFIGVDLTSPLPTGTWTHVAVTWDASATNLLVYLNGVTQTVGSGGSSTTATDNMMTIGSKTDGSQNLMGELDELRIWDHVRTACEIQLSMNSEFTTLQPGMVAYYNFNQGVAGANNAGYFSLPDMSGNYSGTLQSFALNGASSNWVASGAGITAVDQNGVDVAVVQNLNVLTAHATSASYQWLDCNSAYAAIPGEIAQVYTAASNGSYAVQITQAGCVDTSSCFNVVSVGMAENNPLSFVISPNPACDKLNVSFSQVFDQLHIELMNANGALIKVENFENVSKLELPLNIPAGIYFLRITTPEGAGMGKPFVVR